MNSRGNQNNTYRAIIQLSEQKMPPDHTFLCIHLFQRYLNRNTVRQMLKLPANTPPESIETSLTPGVKEV